ncbi:MAG: S-layer homology domain-containing protein [Oscillospiraceae bacterium]|nr:S-layer homology domain-containing protein [Oscillospiraceae bacterium]
MKRKLCVFLAAFLVGFAALPGAVSRAAEGPRLVVDFVPAMDGGTRVTGHVLSGDAAGGFDGWRVTMALQVTRGGTVWGPKPTTAAPSVTLDAYGSFDCLFVSGGEDIRAAVLYVYLIPASFTPNGDGARTEAAALDKVTVYREAGRPNEIVYSKGAPPSAAAPPAQKHPAQTAKLSLCFSPYVNGQSPDLGSALPEAQIRAQLSALRPYADTIRLFSASGALAKVYPIAKEYGFRVIAGCWLDKGAPETWSGELDALVATVNAGLADMAVVGSENLYRGEMTAAQLAAYIREVKSRLNDPSIPVTTSDTAQAWLDNPELAAACDAVLMTVYPFFEGVAIDGAAARLADAYDRVKAIAQGKPCLISETGWPSGGSPEKAAEPGMENAKTYFEDVYAWARAQDVEVMFFSHIDEAWKIEGAASDVGRNWGHFRDDGVLKGAYEAAYRRIAGQSPDETPSSWAVPELNKAVSQGLVPGYLRQGYQRPITREEMADLLAPLAAQLSPQFLAARGPAFDDTDNLNVTRLRALGAIDGVGGNLFDPHRAITREEAAKLLRSAALALGLADTSGTLTYDDRDSIADWARAGVAYVTAGGVMLGTGNNRFSPRDTYTREQAILTMVRLSEAADRD